MRIILAAALGASMMGAAKASESAAEYFSKDRKVEHVSTRAPQKKRQSASSDRAKEVIAYEVRKTLGEQWIPIAMDQVRRESNFRPSAIGPRLGPRHGNQRALGIFQVLPSTARGLGFNPALLNDLRYGTKAGVAYMGKCIDAGVKTSSQMNHCFLHGYHKWRVRNAKPRRDNKRNTRSS